MGIQATYASLFYSLLFQIKKIFFQLKSDSILIQCNIISHFSSHDVRKRLLSGYRKNHVVPAPEKKRSCGGWLDW